MSNDYRQKLRSFISPQSGIIINADEHFERKHPGQKSFGRSGFKLQSGRVVKEFVTIWELFDHRREFEDCVRQLAEKASDIHRRMPFSMIVSCTQTTKELISHLYPLLTTEATGELRVRYFDEYPATPMPQQDGLQFLDEKVLILTDVVSSGNSIRNMAEIIRKQGGRAMAALAVIITNPEWISSPESQSGSYRLQLGEGGLRVHFLSDYPVYPLEESEYDEDKLIPIDYVSVLPREPIYHPLNHLPKFSLQETFSHLEESNAIEFGFYELDGKSYSCSFDFQKLLEVRGKEIWARVRDPILSCAESELPDDRSLILVTTYKQRDLLFKNYVQDRLEEEGCWTTSVVTLKRAVKDTPYLYLNLREERERLKGKTVVLLMATLTTSEKLRGIISLLVASHVKRIVGLCLVNEMGLHTTSFISAIERFTKRIATADQPSFRAEEGDGFTDFEFHVVYSFLDLPSEELAKMQQRLSWLLVQFSGRTKIDSFRRLSGRMQEYFRPRYHLNEQGAPPRYAPLEEPYCLSLWDQPVVVAGQPAKLALITCNLAFSYSFEPVFEELLSTRDRHTFIQLYGLILSDVDYLHFSRSLRRLKDRIIYRLDNLRQERFDWEERCRRENLLSSDAAEPPDSPISEILNAEVYLLFGLGIIAHYETPACLSGVTITWLLFSGRSIDEWLRMPWNLKRHFSEERLFFMISFLLYGIYPAFAKETVGREVKKEIIEQVEAFRDSLKAAVEQQDALASSSFKAIFSLLHDNLDLLLTEAGAHDHQEKHQIVRYLHRQVLRPREGHNPIFTSVTQLLNILDDFFLQLAPENDAFRLPVTEQVLEGVDIALSGTASLPLVARAARQLFLFTPSPHNDQSRYTSSAGQSNSFASDSQGLIKMISEIRRRRSTSREEVNRIKVLFSVIRDDFFSSHLRGTLERYVVPLEEVLLKAMLEANERLNKEGFHDLLKEECRRISGERANGAWHLPVLCDRILLQEAFRNILSNLRHSFAEEQRQSLAGDAVRISYERDCRIAIHPENLLQEAIGLRIEVSGDPPRLERLSDRAMTLPDQRAKLKEFGCEWKIRDWPGEKGFTHELVFISRIGFVNVRDEARSRG